MHLPIQMWHQKLINQQDLLTAQQRHGLSDLLAKVLLARNIAIDNLDDFLEPKLRNLLPDPLHLKDMDKAVERTLKALKDDEIIYVFGDYDVDGACSTALLIRFFRKLGMEAKFYIPDRLLEGFGPTAYAMDRMKEAGASLVITVDCGTVSFDAMKHAKAIGLDVIIIDHHKGEPQHPESIAVVNPNRLDETSDYTYLAAVGIAFLFCVALKTRLPEKQVDLLQLLDLVALATVCDVMPLNHINRAFVKQGLKVIANRSNLGLKHLMDRKKIDSYPSVFHLGFMIGPMINAGGRVGKASLGCELLSSDNETRIMQIIDELEGYNSERQTLQTLVFEQADLMAAKQVSEGRSFLFLAKENWHEGVVGIVASKLKDKYGLPVAVMEIKPSHVKASSRSVVGLDIGTAIINARNLGLLIAGGGHKMAGGFNFTLDKYYEVEKYFSELKIGHNTDNAGSYYDAALSLTGVNMNLTKELEKLEPFGTGFEAPIFAIHGVSVSFFKQIGQDSKHIVIGFTDNGGKKQDSVWFNFADKVPDAIKLLSKRDATFNVYAKLSVNNRFSTPTAQLIVQDLEEC
jgi:single-stranded-DNA-specific exonuclease